MNINKIKKGIITLGLVGTLGSCATIDNFVERLHQEPEPIERPIRPSVMDYRALKILGVEHSPSFAVELPEGYLTTEGGRLILKYLAAVKSGNNDFNTNEIIDVLGRRNPGLESTREDYLSILKKADANGDRIITRQEIYNLERQMRQEYK